MTHTSSRRALIGAVFIVVFSVVAYGGYRLHAARVAALQEVPNDCILNVATLIGAEPGGKSLGGDQVFQKGSITISPVKRLRRDRSIYDIEPDLRRRINRIPGLLHANVLETGRQRFNRWRGAADSETEQGTIRHA